MTLFNLLVNLTDIIILIHVDSQYNYLAINPLFQFFYQLVKISKQVTMIFVLL